MHFIMDVPLWTIYTLSIQCTKVNKVNQTETSKTKEPPLNAKDMADARALKDQLEAVIKVARELTEAINKSLVPDIDAVAEKTLLDLLAPHKGEHLLASDVSKIMRMYRTPLALPKLQALAIKSGAFKVVKSNKYSEWRGSDVTLWSAATKYGKRQYCVMPV